LLATELQLSTDQAPRSMSSHPQVRIPATYMRGGTSKGVFFQLKDLPENAQQPGPERDRLLQRVIGSPDPYGKQIDGMGGATSSTSKVAIVSRSERDDHDVDYMFGQVAVDRPLIDWSGNCGNLTAAVAVFAINSGFVDAESMTKNGLAQVRIWQQNTGKSIIAEVPVRDGEVLETGDFFLDGVAFSGAPITLDFHNPSDDADVLFPSGKLLDHLKVDNNISGYVEATLINAGIPAVLLDANQIGLTATELEGDINDRTEHLELLEELRVQGALKMGLIDSPEQAAQLQHTPKIIWLATAANYRASNGQLVPADSIDVCARALSMGKLHHAMMASAAVAMASAAAIPGTLVSQLAGRASSQLRLGHTCGTLAVGAEAKQSNDNYWQINRATMQRSARVLMEGWVRVPADFR